MIILNATGDVYTTLKFLGHRSPAITEIKVKVIIKDVDAIKNFAEEYNSYEDAKKVRIKIGIFLFQMIDSITTNQDTI
jgi:hypothetical protein